MKTANQSISLALRCSLLLAGLALPAAITASAAGGDDSAQGSTVPTALADSPSVYMVRYRPGPSYEQDKPLLKQDLRDHGAYMAKLARDGTVIAAGPTMAELGGLVLVEVKDLAAAQAVTEADPAVRSGIFTAEVSDWRPVFDPGNRFKPE